MSGLGLSAVLHQRSRAPCRADVLRAMIRAGLDLELLATSAKPFLKIDDPLLRARAREAWVVAERRLPGGRQRRCPSGLRCRVDSFPVHVSVDASMSRGEIRRIWRFFGADEPNYSAMPNGRKLHEHLGELSPGEICFRALPEAVVGGPDSAGSGREWMRRFLEHVLRGTNFATGETGTPLDFVSFHAKRSPDFVDEHVRMGIARQLRDINEGFGIIASYPELQNTPIVIGESDPEGCAAARAIGSAIGTGRCIRAAPPPALRGNRISRIDTG